MDADEARRRGIARHRDVRVIRNSGRSIATRRRAFYPEVTDLPPRRGRWAARAAG